MLADVAALGHGDKPHIINALRCRTRRGAFDEKTNHVVHGMRTLWMGTRFGRFCTEANHAVDPRHSIHVPYCPAVASSLSSCPCLLHHH